MYTHRYKRVVQQNNSFANKKKYITQLNVITKVEQNN